MQDHKSLSISHIILFLEEYLDIEIQYKNTNSAGKYVVYAEESKTEEFEVSFNCPSAGGEYLFTLEAEINIIESNYKGDYYNPPDPDEIDCKIDIVSAIYVSDDGECVDFQVDKLLKDKLMNKFNEVIEIE